MKCPKKHVKDIFFTWLHTYCIRYVDKLAHDRFLNRKGTEYEILQFWGISDNYGNAITWQNHISCAFWGISYYFPYINMDLVPLQSMNWKLFILFNMVVHHHSKACSVDFVHVKIHEDTCMYPCRIWCEGDIKDIFSSIVP